MGTTVQFRVKASKQFGTVPDWMQSAHAGKRYVQLPDGFKRGQYIDRTAARKCPKLSPYSNSDLLPNLVLRSMRDAGQVWESGEHWRVWLDAPGVTVDETGFLAEVTISVS